MRIECNPSLADQAAVAGVPTAGPIHIVQDGARYHMAKEMVEFIAQHGERLRVHQLPSYSPDYNPIEHLWRNVKRGKTHNRYFATFEALQAAVEEALAHYQGLSQEVKQLMGTILDQLAGADRLAA